jgi:cytochrome c2
MIPAGLSTKVDGPRGTFTASGEHKEIHMIRTALVILGIVLYSGAVWGADQWELYEKKCMLCHSLGERVGKKAELGGALDDVGSKRDEAWLRAYFADPKSKIEGAKMPKLKLTQEEWDAVLALMLSSKKTAP